MDISMIKDKKNFEEYKIDLLKAKYKYLIESYKIRMKSIKLNKN